MNKYIHSKIYKISSPQTDKIYIGSTCKELYERLSKHKNHYRDYLNGKQKYITSYEIIKFSDCIIELIEKVNCDNKKDLLIREGYYIRLYKNNVVNKYIAGRTRNEYKKQIKNCLCGSKYTLRHKARHLRTKKHIMNMQENIIIDIN